MLARSIVVKTLQELYSLQEHDPDEIVFCEETGKIYIWDEIKGRIPISTENKGLEINLYELNKNVIGQFNPLTIDELNMKTNLLMDYYNIANNTYHMLLCKDYNYYTIFSFSTMPEFTNFAEAVITIITELGDIYSIEFNDDNALEIWIKPLKEESPYVFYLFPYDAGVVYYG